MSIRVCCENGRTALHDACWSLGHNTSASCENPFAMMQLLLEECPLLLFIQDKRGHSPPSYVPKTMRADCHVFLDRMKAKGLLN